jgi:hypothetical protein
MLVLLSVLLKYSTWILPHLFFYIPTIPTPIKKTQKLQDPANWRSNATKTALLDRRSLRPSKKVCEARGTSILSWYPLWDSGTQWYPLWDPGIVFFFFFLFLFLFFFLFVCFFLNPVWETVCLLFVCCCLLNRFEHKSRIKTKTKTKTKTGTRAGLKVSIVDSYLTEGRRGYNIWWPPIRGQEGLLTPSQYFLFFIILDLTLDRTKDKDKDKDKNKDKDQNQVKRYVRSAAPPYSVDTRYGIPGFFFFLFFFFSFFFSLFFFLFVCSWTRSEKDYMSSVVYLIDSNTSQGSRSRQGQEQE